MKLIVIFFWSNTLIVYLCSEVNCLYIVNAKLIDFMETFVVSLFFIALLVSFFILEDYSPPNPSVFYGIDYKAKP